MLRRLILIRLPLLDAPSRRQVAVDQIMGRSLVGDQIGTNAAIVGALGQFGHDIRSIAQQADRNRLLAGRSEEHTSELQSLMRISYAVFCLKNKKIERDKHITQFNTSSPQLIPLLT